MAKMLAAVALEEYAKDFPFIRPWIQEVRRSCFSWIEPKASVQRLDLDVLESRAFHIGSERDRYFIIGQGGQVICEVAEKKVDYESVVWWNPFSWFPRESPGQTVRDALEMISGGPDGNLAVSYVVLIRTNMAEASIVIYKCPKEFCLAVFLDQESRKIGEETRARLEAEIRQAG